MVAHAYNPSYLEEQEDHGLREAQGRHWWDSISTNKVGVVIKCQ
jgi:hypothetical protein